MARYQCCNCECIAGDQQPSECSVCHTTEFVDIEPLDNSSHPKNLRRDAHLVFYAGIGMLVLGFVMSIGFYVSHGPVGAFSGLVPLVGGFVNMTVWRYKLLKLRT
jgi:hypothetical protein